MASCHTHAALLLILPQKPQNAQKFLAEKSIPQTHRRRVWHPCHTHAALLLILPQKPQNAQKFLAEKSLPQMHTDEHRLGVPAGGVGMAGCHTLLQKLPQIALPRNTNNIATLQQQDCHATIKHRKRTSNQETNKQSRNERTPTLHISRETDGK